MESFKQCQCPTPGGRRGRKTRDERRAQPRVPAGWTSEGRRCHLPPSAHSISATAEQAQLTDSEAHRACTETFLGGDGEEFQVDGRINGTQGMHAQWLLLCLGLPLFGIGCVRPLQIAHMHSTPSLRARPSAPLLSERPVRMSSTGPWPDSWRLLPCCAWLGRRKKRDAHSMIWRQRSKAGLGMVFLLSHCLPCDACAPRLGAHYLSSH